MVWAGSTTPTRARISGLSSVLSAGTRQPSMRQIYDRWTPEIALISPANLPFVRALSRLQLRQQFLEVVTVAQRVEVGVFLHVSGVLVACLHGLLQQFHRPVSVLL